ncbi:hypothetical protein [Nocardia sp. NPDC049149]|uniref:hypothetical protein n=1 Tax=Nocardia sp. NPDC049149 TaxID=3364315 RepID=UPI003717B678
MVKRIRALAVILLATVACLAVAPAAGADESGAGSSAAGALQADGRCVIDRANPAVTVDSLRFHCTTAQADALFLAAAPGERPQGRQRFWVLPAVHVLGAPIPYPFGRAWAASEGVLGDSLTFAPGPGKRDWCYKNYRVGGQDTGGPVVPGRSYADNKPSWTIDFSADFVGVPISYHEFRQIAPGVWLGWSYFLQGWNPSPDLPIHGSYVITE